MSEEHPTSISRKNENVKLIKTQQGERTLSKAYLLNAMDVPGVLPLNITTMCKVPKNTNLTHFKIKLTQ